MADSLSFWARVEKPLNGCWPWKGTRKRGSLGYGAVTVTSGGQRKVWLPHRLAWTITFGPIPDGICVLHDCDVPWCVRPSHLRLGTIAENNADCRARGRWAHGNSKLAKEQIASIRSLKTPFNHTSVAASFGISRRQLVRVWKGESWKL